MSGLMDYSVAFKPFQYPWAMEAAVAHEKIHWGEWEADLQEDVKQWKSGGLTETEKAHITQILRLFTQSDVQVGGNYCDLFIPKFRNNEIRNMLLSFANREGVHQRAYALLNDTLGLHEKEYWAFMEYEELAAKIEFMQDNDVSTKSGLGRAFVASSTKPTPGARGSSNLVVPSVGVEPSQEPTILRAVLAGNDAFPLNDAWSAPRICSASANDSTTYEAPPP